MAFQEIMFQTGYTQFRFAYLKIALKAVWSAVEFWLAASDVCIFSCVASVPALKNMFDKFDTLSNQQESSIA